MLSPTFLLPPPNPSANSPRLEKTRRRPSTESIPPYASNAGPETGPNCFCPALLGVHGGVSVGVISDAHVGIEPHPVGFGEGVVGVDEAAFGGFEVVGCEGVGDAAEAEGGGGVEWGGVESDFWWGKGGAVELGIIFFWWEIC